MAGHQTVRGVPPNGAIASPRPKSTDGKTAAAVLQRVIQVPLPLRESVVYDAGIVYMSQEALRKKEYYAYQGLLKRHGLFKEQRVIPLPEIKAKHIALAALAAGREALDAGTALWLMRDLILRACEMRASDMHLFVVKGRHCEVHYRIDGLLRHSIDLRYDEAVQLIRATYTKMDGVNAQQWSEDEICFGTIRSHDLIPPTLEAIRFSSSRESAGAMVALRMLPKPKEGATLDNLGISPALLPTIKEMARAGSGLMFASGPTGAGKSTYQKFLMEWLYAKFPYHHTIGVEDPCEYKIQGVHSINVLIQDNEDPSVDERALAWLKVIATAMRLDPNRIFIGEIRDGGAARAAVRAAQTGHPTFSTLHANDSFETINRFLDLLHEGGMYNPVGIMTNTSNFIGATAQRLMPALCDCKIPLAGNEARIGGKHGQLHCDLVAAIENFETVKQKIYLRGDGCDRCVPEARGDIEERKNAPGAGIYGRTLVMEVFHATQEILDIVASPGGVPAAKRAWLRSGGTILIDDALRKVLSGATSPEFIEEFVGPIVTGRMVLERSHRDQNILPMQQKQNTPTARHAGQS